MHGFFLEPKTANLEALLYSTFTTDIIKVGLVFSISNFFIKKSSLANKWMTFSYSNSALHCFSTLIKLSTQNLSKWGVNYCDRDDSYTSKAFCSIKIALSFICRFLEMKSLTATLLLMLIWFHQGQGQSEKYRPHLPYHSGYILRSFSNCNVQTIDGYCLEPQVLKKEGIEKIRGKAFLQHGLLGSGVNWLLSGPEKVS